MTQKGKVSSCPPRKAVLGERNDDFLFERRAKKTFLISQKSFSSQLRTQRSAGGPATKNSKRAQTHPLLGFSYKGGQRKQNQTFHQWLSMQQSSAYVQLSLVQQRDSDPIDELELDGRGRRAPAPRRLACSYYTYIASWPHIDWLSR